MQRCLQEQLMRPAHYILTCDQVYIDSRLVTGLDAFNFTKLHVTGGIQRTIAAAIVNAPTYKQVSLISCSAWYTQVNALKAVKCMYAHHHQNPNDLITIGDVAVARLSAPVTQVNPVKLYTTPVTVKDNLVVLGWGSTSDTVSWNKFTQNWVRLNSTRPTHLQQV